MNDDNANDNVTGNVNVDVNDDRALEDDALFVSVPNKILVGIHVKRHDELPSAASSVATFINVLREETGEPFVLDVQAAVNVDNAGFRKTAAIGFTADTSDDEDDFYDDDSDDGIDKLNVKGRGRR